LLDLAVLLARRGEAPPELLGLVADDERREQHHAEGQQIAAIVDLQAEIRLDEEEAEGDEAQHARQERGHVTEPHRRHDHPQQAATTWSSLRAPPRLADSAASSLHSSGVTCTCRPSTKRRWRSRSRRNLPAGSEDGLSIRLARGACWSQKRIRSRRSAVQNGLTT